MCENNLACSHHNKLLEDDDIIKNKEYPWKLGSCRLRSCTSLLLL